MRLSTLLLLDKLVTRCRCVRRVVLQNVIPVFHQIMGDNHALPEPQVCSGTAVMMIGTCRDFTKSMS